MAGVSGVSELMLDITCTIPRKGKQSGQDFMFSLTFERLEALWILGSQSTVQAHFTEMLSLATL